MKVKYLILVQCLMITFVLYMFREFFIITLPVWLITLPVTAPLLIYIVIRYFKKRKSRKFKSEDNKIELEVSKETYDYLLSCIVLELNGKEYIERNKVQSMLVKFVKEQTVELVHALTVAQKRLENLINATPTGELRNTLTDENLILLSLLNKMNGESNVFGETVYLEDCSWNKNPKVRTVDVHYETSHSHNYGNGRDMETYETLDAAIKYCKTKYTPENHPNMSKENFEYWNKQSGVVTKVTTIKEIMSVIKPEERN